MLAGYARRHKLKRMRAFVSETTAYRKVVERVDWKNAGVDDAVLLIPERGSQDSVTRTQGEAFAALLGGTLEREWRSATGLRLRAAGRSMLCGAPCEPNLPMWTGSSISGPGLGKVGLARM